MQNFLHGCQGCIRRNKGTQDKSIAGQPNDLIEIIEDNEEIVSKDKKTTTVIESSINKEKKPTKGNKLIM
jgi:hypothetical protein